MYKVSIIGATGYVGAEITRILVDHPGFSISKLTSRSFAGKLFSDIYPSMKGVLDLPLEELDIDSLCAASDFVVTALPHGVSSQIVPKLLERNVKVIDHSGDYRFRKIEDYERAYHMKHNSIETNELAVYGIPELYRDKIKKTNLVSNPGCYPTCSILGLAPLLSNNIVSKKGIVINAVSGVSGAGRKDSLAFSYCETNENYKAYSPVGHRHTAEIEQEYSLLAKDKINVTFTPHLAPMKRGMVCSIYADLDVNCDENELIKIYEEAYSKEPFVRFIGKDNPPNVKHVSGTNYIDVSFSINRETNKVIVFSAQDNLGKGASSQAVQCMNVMASYEETLGLLRPALYI